MAWNELILEPLRTFLGWLVVFAPRALGALLLLLVGWVLAGLSRRIIVGVLRAVGLDRLSEKARLSDVLQRGAIRWTFVELVGQMAYWVILIATVIIALQAVGMTVAAEWLEHLGYFIPRLIISIAILLFGTLMASFLGATVRVASLNAGFPRGYVLGQAVHTTVVFLTVIVALEQLQVVTRTIQVALYILLGAFGLAFALALGLGARDLVKEFLIELRDRWKTSRGS